MIARTMLGAQLLACAEECGSVAALARELGVCAASLADLIEGGEPSMRTFRAVVRYVGPTADDVLAAMDAADDGRQWKPDASVGGKARQAGLCDSCGSRLSREAALARWAETRAREHAGQMTIMEASA